MFSIFLFFILLFIDTDKQQAINLFLGTFKPKENIRKIWDIPTDYYLHHSSTMNLKSFAVRQRYAITVNYYAFVNQPSIC